MPAKLRGSAAGNVITSPLAEDDAWHVATRPPRAGRTAHPEIHPRNARHGFRRDLQRRKPVSNSRQVGRLASRASKSRKTMRNVAKASSMLLRLLAVSPQPRRCAAEPSGRNYGGVAQLVRFLCPARRLGSMSERRLSNPSAVTRPAATSSHRAVSISAFNFPLPRTMSAKKDAPRCRRKLSTNCAP